MQIGMPMKGLRRNNDAMKTYSWYSKQLTQPASELLKLIKQYPPIIKTRYSTGPFRLLSFSALSFLNSSLPNFQVKLRPTERKGILRLLFTERPGPYKVTVWLMYALKKLLAVNARLPFLFQNCFLTARL